MISSSWHHVNLKKILSVFCTSQSAPRPLLKIMYCMTSPVSLSGLQRYGIRPLFSECRKMIQRTVTWKSAFATSYKQATGSLWVSATLCSATVISITKKKWTFSSAQISVLTCERSKVKCSTTRNSRWGLSYLNRRCRSLVTRQKEILYSRRQFYSG